MATLSVKDYILYYKIKLDRCKDNEDLILETIHKLAKPTAVTAEIIQETGILKYLHKLCKRKGRVADAALPLFNKWKLLLSIAIREKDNLKKSSPAEGRPNNSSSTVTKSQAREGDPPSRGNHTTSDRDPASHVPHRSRDSHPERALKRKDPFPPGDAKRASHHSHRDRDPKHHTLQKDQPPPDAKPSRSANPSHRSSDSDSDRGSRHHSAKKDYFASDVDSTRDSTHHGNPKHLPAKKDLFPSEISSNSSKGRDGNYKSRKELFAPDTDSTRTENVSHHGSSKYLSAQRDLFASETDGTCKANRGSDSGYPVPKKDYFTQEADTSRPNSASSEHNGISNSQDSNHIDIDSLSNPNLSIETTQVERLNSSDDAEHASPTKRAKTLEPYYIEMREGMFRAVKNHASPFSGSGLRVCELIHREIIKGNTTYKKESEKLEKQKRNDASLPFTMSPRENSSDGEKWCTKNGPSEPKPGTERSGRASSAAAASKHDLKRKSVSPMKGSDKKMRLDSTSDHKSKNKKEVHSPSHLSKPLNNVEAVHRFNCDRNKNPKIQDSSPETSMQYISSKKDRRAVYSGRKSAQDISTLKCNCLRVLRKNLDYLRCPVTVPYETLHPILETLNPTQLSRIEEHNTHLVAYTNSLWKQHYHREHRSQVVGKSEKDILWKEEYNRAIEQQRKKLKNLTASINAAASKAKPDRQAKVVDSHHDFGRRTRTPEVPIVSSKAPSASLAIVSRSSSSPTPPKASTSVPRTLAPIISKPKEAKHSVTHKPVKKVVAPLMSKVKKSMAVYRQK